ncbi:MAG: Bcr/CflA family efflux MFS transporter [Pseudomonadota bacterium]
MKTQVAAPAPTWLLVLVTFSATVAMHMFVPALTVAGADLQASAAAMQTTITVYIIGLAVGQLLYGPLSDRIGRRPTLLVGLSLFSVASLGCLLAPSAQLLIYARFAQALGGCAGLMLARAIVSDTGGEHTLKQLGLLSLMAMLSPGFAPLLGSLVVAVAGWRAMFACFVALGVVSVFFTWRLLPETRQMRPADAGGSVLHDAWALLKSPVFVGCVIGGGGSTSAYYAFITAAPFLFVTRLHEPVHTVGPFLTLIVSTMLVGAYSVRLMAGRLPAMRIAAAAGLLSTTAAIVVLLRMLLGSPGSAEIVVAMMVYSLGVGICSPAASAASMAINPKVAGSAAGVYGAGQMAIGALCAASVSLMDDHALAAFIVLAVAGIAGQLGFRVALRAERAAAA